VSKRLEEIKDRWINDKVFWTGNIDYLIKQAERVKKLELELLYYKMATKSYVDIEQQNKRYLEALEFYANEENYLFDEKEYKVGLGVPESEITLDYGNKARKALER